MGKSIFVIEAHSVSQGERGRGSADIDREETAVTTCPHLLYVPFLMWLLIFIHTQKALDPKHSLASFIYTCFCHAIPHISNLLLSVCLMLLLIYSILNVLRFQPPSIFTLLHSSSLVLHIAIMLDSPLPPPPPAAFLASFSRFISPSFASSFTHHTILSHCQFLSFSSLPPLSFCHMLFSAVLLCLMPVGLWPWMLHVLLCVSRAHSLLLLQLCWKMAPLTLRSAAVMLI